MTAIHLGQGGYAASTRPGGGPLGYRWVLNLVPALSYVEETPPVISALTEEGAVVNFTKSGASWIAESGRVATLEVANVGPCDGTATLRLGNGDRYTFHEPCGGTDLREGRIQRIDRPDGEFLRFVPDLAGRVGRVENRFGSGVNLLYNSLGRLTSATLPTGESFVFGFRPNGWPSSNTADFLASIKKQGDSANLWTMEYAANGGAQIALTKIRDAKNQRQLEWTFTDANMTRVLREYGPGSSTTNYIEFDNLIGSTKISFVDANGVARTSTYEYTENQPDRERVTVRTAQGSCTNCGSENLKRLFWAGTVHPRVVEQGNGFVTAFDTSAGTFSAAYDVLLGNPLIVYEGCDGPADGSWAWASKCGSARRRAYSYQAGTRVVKSSTRPSVNGAPITNTRTFDGTSTRVDVDEVEGRTAMSLDGVVDDLKRRETDFDYTVVASNAEISVVKGPYWEGDADLSDDPRTEYAYYTTTIDACSGGANPANLRRLKTITRFVDASRTLVATMCDYDSMGRARKIKHPDNSITKVTYNWRGQITQTVVDDGVLNLTTDSVFDANGNLIELKLPRSEGGNRSGWKYVLDDADRITNVQRGYFNVSTGAFTLIEEMRNEFDHVGNRTKTEYKDAAGAVVVSEGAKYDQFNRLVCIARPWAADCSMAASKTTFAHDPEGNLKLVSDAQGDEVKYGSVASGLQTYNRFGKIERISQEVCDHPASDPNGACASPSWACAANHQTRDCVT